LGTTVLRGCMIAALCVCRSVTDILSVVTKVFLYSGLGRNDKPGRVVEESDGRFDIVTVCLFFMVLCHVPILASPSFAEEYTFDVSEVEKKPYHIGGYIEFYPILFGLDKNSAMYKLNFYDRNMAGTTEQYNGNLQVDASLEKGISRAYMKTFTSYTDSWQTQTTKTHIFEGYLSVKPSSSFIVDAGKKTMNWGKGYAWNPAAFLDRPKDPNDPELSREGFIVGSIDYTRSFTGGALKTFSFTPVLVPVYSGVNDDLGEVDHVNLASKFYFLFQDTDIDVMFLTGGSRTTRYGMDFSRNITTNLEVHGEFSLINGYEQTYTDTAGTVSKRSYTAKNYLVGLRYLTKSDTTYIVEYYRNGTGYSTTEMRDFYSFTDRAYERYITTGSTDLLARALNLNQQGAYGRINPAVNYLYIRVMQKDPFDILYYTPAVTLIANIDDKSFSLTPEITYTGITNLELRLRTGIIAGTRGSEYGEKQNDYRIDFRARYYF